MDIPFETALETPYNITSQVGGASWVSNNNTQILTRNKLRLLKGFLYLFLLIRIAPSPTLRRVNDLANRFTKSFEE